MEELSASATQPDLRASDAERERVAVQLRDHTAAGRLDVEELTQRLDAVYAARTHAELAALVADLPRASRRHAGRLGFQIHRNVYLLVGALLLATWALSGAGYFWPAWPMAGWGIGLFSHGSAVRAKRRRQLHRSNDAIAGLLDGRRLR